MNLEIIHFITLIIFLNILVSLYIKITKSKTNALYCGIIGYSGKKSSNPDKLALLMLHNSLKRGEDNTGIYTLETGVVKKAKKAEEFLAEVEIPKTHLFIGHVRKASVGSKVEKNAHPFENDNIVLCHNGTLTNHWTMCSEAGYKSVDYDTDTQVLAKLIDDDSKKEDKLFSTLSEYLGFAALLFTDKREPDVLYAYRNEDRPLFYGHLDGGMYISSMKENLLIIGCQKIDEFKSLYLYRIKNGKLLDATFYKEKEKAKTNHYVQNVKFKDLDKSAENFVQIILGNSNKQTKLDQLQGRWVKAITNYDDTYGDIVGNVKITKDKWYYVEDVSYRNEYDLQFKDDNDKLSWNNIYAFNTNYIDYPNGYGVATKNIYLYGKPDETIFKKGTLIEIIQNGLISEENTIPCVQDNDNIINIYLDCLRPATALEVSAIIKKNNPVVNNTAQKVLNFEDYYDVYEEYENYHHNANTKLLSPPVKNRPLVGPETEITSENESNDEAALILGLVLDDLDDIADDLIDLSESTSWDELKTKAAELKDRISEAYNIEQIREYIKESGEDLDTPKDVKNKNN